MPEQMKRPPTTYFSGKRTCFCSRSQLLVLVPCARHVINSLRHQVQFFCTHFFVNLECKSTPIACARMRHHSPSGALSMAKKVSSVLICAYFLPDKYRGKYHNNYYYTHQCASFYFVLLPRRVSCGTVLRLYFRFITSFCLFLEFISSLSNLPSL